MLWQVFVVALSGLLVAVSAAERPEDVLMRALAKPFAPVQPLLEISRQCREDSLLYLEQLNNYTSWAMHMYDASTKIPSGILTGNVQQLGNFDQCIGISVQRNSHSFQGQLCTAAVQFTLSDFSNTSNDAHEAGLRELLVAMAKASDLPDWHGPRSAPYTWAFCVPSSCSAGDVQAALNHALLPLNMPGVAEVIVTTQPENCKVARKSLDLQVADYCCLAVLLVFITVAIFSTIYDVTTLAVENKEVQGKDRLRILLTSFSLYTNSKFLFSTKHGSDTMACLDGFRFLSIIWIIFGHSYYQIAISPQINSIVIKYFHQEWSKMLIMNGTVSTDTFFVLSGMLLTYRFMRERQLNQPFSVLTLYLQRYIRLTPVYAMVVFFYATLFQYIGTGPLWSLWVNTNRDNCQQNWWTNLLYINNYINVPNICLSQSWYLAVDMQLLWLSPIVLVPLWKWPVLGKVIFGLIFLVSIAVPFFVTWLRQLAAAMFYTADSIAGVYLEVYIPVYTRGGSYMVGMALGYLWFCTKGKKIKFTKLQIFFGWLITVISGLVVIFGILPMYQPEHPYSALESAVYASLHRCVWALAISWVIFICLHGYGGPVNAILSWSVFQPFSRLTYGAYLGHFMVLLYNSGSARTPAYLSDYSVIHDFLGNLIMILAIAIILSLLFEIPFTTLGRVLLRSDAVPQVMSDAVVGIRYSKTEEYSVPIPEEAGVAKEACYDNEGFEDLRNKLQESFLHPVRQTPGIAHSSFSRSLSEVNARSIR